jgi:thioredoxin reductase (NADPH)
VIIAAGGQPRLLGVAGEERLHGRGVSSCAICDGAFFRDRVVAVVGGGDSALQEAAYLTRFVRQVYVLHRRDRWSAQRQLQERALGNPAITPIWDAVVEEIGGDDKVEWLKYRNVRTGVSERLAVDAVFIYVGFVPNGKLCGPDCQRDEQGFLVTDESMQTHVPGVFVAGDVRSRYVRQIATAVGDAVTAAVAATHFVEGLAADDESTFVLAPGGGTNERKSGLTRD